MRLVGISHMVAVSVCLLTLGAVRPSEPTDQMEREITAKYPRAPKTLDTDPELAGVLLIDVKREGLLARALILEGVALRKEGSGPELIRAACMKGDLVLFPSLPPGTYALVVIKGGNYNVEAAFLVPTNPDFSIQVAPGKLQFLGTVVMKKKFGMAPPELLLHYDPQREIDAWLAFSRKYPDTSWSALAAARISSIRQKISTEAKPK